MKSSKTFSDGKILSKVEKQLQEYHKDDNIPYKSADFKWDLAQVSTYEDAESAAIFVPLKENAKNEYFKEFLLT